MIDWIVPKLKKIVTLSNSVSNFIVYVNVRNLKLTIETMNTPNHFQVIILVMIVGLVVIRLFSGPPPPRGAVALSNLKVSELKQQSFEVSGPLDVIINAVGSIDDREEMIGLGAYPWITNNSSGDVVWSMNESNSIQQGTLVSVVNDEIKLESGDYTLSFASFGQPLHYVKPSFWKDMKKWYVTLNTPDDSGALRPITGSFMTEPVDEFFDATSLRRNEKREYLFEVLRTTDFDIHAIGEFGTRDEGKAVDYSWIEDVVNSQVIWQLTLDNTTWAGGALQNRIFSDRVTLPPGVYRAVAETDNTHHYKDWVGNPPFRPHDWGFRMTTTDRDAVTTFDPWLRYEPIIKFTQVGDDEEYEQSFTVTSSTTIILYALGEITGPDNGYDYAWLDRQESDGEFRTLWKMTYNGSARAGGGRKNRKEVVFLRLEPGNYRLNYESDGSHAYDAWNAGKPDFPERWGVTLFSYTDENPDIVVGSESELSIAPLFPFLPDNEFTEEIEEIVNSLR